MPIRKLGYSTGQRLRSHVVIDSMETVLRELIQNGLDAGATFLRIKLDPQSLSVCVEDNGRGMSPLDFSLVGKRNYSSSCNPSDRRGEALCSIGFCCAQVVLRTKMRGGQECSGSLAGRACLPELLGVLSGFFELDTVPVLGTQVMVSRAFSRLPVRRHTNRMLANSDALKQQLRLVMFEMLHGYVSVAAEALLLDNGSFETVLKVDLCQSNQELFCHLFRLPREFTVLKDERSGCSFSGFFSLEGSRKLAHQFVFINGRKLNRQSGINAIFNAAGYKRSQRGLLGRSLRLFPLYCFDLTHPLEDVQEAVSFLESKLLELLNVKMRLRLSGTKKLVLPTTQTPSQKDNDEGFLGHQVGSEVPISLVSMHNVATLTVVNQILNQFILAALEGQIFVLDQHACDERIRVEELFAEYSTTITDNMCNNKVRCSTPVGFAVSTEEASDLLLFQTLFNTFGIQFDITESCTVTHLPRVLAHITQPELLKGLLLQHVNDIVEGEKQLVVTGNWIQDVPNLPLAIFQALVSSACRLSIKFGDILVKAEMEYLIHQLGECSLPFQCAHGRTTIVPLHAAVKGFLEDEEL